MFKTLLVNNTFPHSDTGSHNFTDKGTKEIKVSDDKVISSFFFS